MVELLCATSACRVWHHACHVQMCAPCRCSGYEKAHSLRRLGNLVETLSHVHGCLHACSRQAFANTEAADFVFDLYLMQVAMDMKAQGMYVCRTLSFEGAACPLTDSRRPPPTVVPPLSLASCAARISGMCVTHLRRRWQRAVYCQPQGMPQASRHRQPPALLFFESSSKSQAADAEAGDPQARSLTWCTRSSRQP